MNVTITITVSSDDPAAPLAEYVSALETLMSWQWDNISIDVEGGDTDA